MNHCYCKNELWFFFYAWDEGVCFYFARISMKIKYHFTSLQYIVVEVFPFPTLFLVCEEHLSFNLKKNDSKRFVLWVAGAFFSCSNAFVRNFACNVCLITFWPSFFVGAKLLELCTYFKIVSYILLLFVCLFVCFLVMLLFLFSVFLARCGAVLFSVVFSFFLLNNEE